MNNNSSETRSFFRRILCALFAFTLLTCFAGCAAGKTSERETYPPTTDAIMTPGESALPYITDTPEPSVPVPDPTPQATVLPVTVWTRAKYLGVYGYGSIDANTLFASTDPIYRFLVDGSEVRYSINSDKAFTVQNALMRGYDCRIVVKNGCVEAAFTDGSGQEKTSPVDCKPGLRTIKNFLASAIQPLGHTLYVYGGGWNWQDDGASVQARSFGASGSWKRFFDEQTADYRYKDENDRSGGFYPFGGWNEYYFAGLDCSGYIGWAVYNTIESESGQDGYVYKSTDIAKTYASLGLGAYSREAFGTDSNPLLPGDIVSISGHAYIVVGTCADGSILILHSSPTDSITGAKGGGVQFGAIDRAGRGEKCDAYRLASRYQSLYFPEWAARYPVEMRPFGKYLSFDKSGASGVFRWHRDKRGLFDPDGYSALCAEDILTDLFGE